MEKFEDVINLIDAQEKEKTKSLVFNYLKHWPWFIGFCLAGVFAGYFVFKNTPYTYQISSRILVKGQEAELSNVLAFNNAGSNTRNNSKLNNQIGIFQSYSLYKKALQNLGWYYSWHRKKLLYDADLYKNEPFELIIPPAGKNAKDCLIEISMINDNEYNVIAKGETYQNGYYQLIDINQNVKFGVPFANDIYNFTLNRKNGRVGESYFLKFNDIDALTNLYLKKTSVYAEEENSDIITILIEGQTPQRAADFINELNNVIVKFGMENKFENSENSVKFIDSQLESLKNSLGTAKENFSNYRKNNQAMDLGQEAQSVYERMEEIENEKYLTQLQLEFYNNLQRSVNDAKKIEEMANPSIIGITDENLSGMLSNLRQLYSRRELLSYSAQEKNPTMVLLDKEIMIVRNGLEQTVQNQLEATELKIQSLNDRYSQIQQRLRRLPETEKKLIDVQREFDLNNEFYTYMLQKKAEASILKASIAPEVQIIDEAIVEASKYVGPFLMKNVIVGFMGGGIIPFLLITLMIFFNTKIETVNEIEKKSRIPVFEGIMRHKYKVKLPVIHHPRSGIAESFRGLKTNINTVLQDKETRVISINSLLPGEGKSFISSNLSVIISKTNKKVLLIGSDLHKPTLHNFLGVNESFGLSNYLKNEKSLEDIISATSIPNLFFIQTGSVPENPSDLLDSLKFEQLINQSRKMFDFVVIDNAPLMLVPDAILTSQFSDISLFILRINYSHKDQIKQINKIVDFNKITEAAIVVNDVNEKGYGYAYGYRKKYWKNGYGEIKDQKS